MSSTGEPAQGLSQPRRILLLVTLVFVLVQGWTAFRPGTTDDERHYFFSAHWINQEGDWLTPHDQYHGLRIHKPPLFTWLTALAFKFTGPRIAALRGVAILAGALSAGPSTSWPGFCSAPEPRPSWPG